MITRLASLSFLFLSFPSVRLSSSFFLSSISLYISTTVVHPRILLGVCVCVVTASYVPCNRIRVVSLRARSGEHTGKQRIEQGGSAEPKGAASGGAMGTVRVYVRLPNVCCTAFGYGYGAPFSVACLLINSETLIASRAPGPSFRRAHTCAHRTYAAHAPRQLSADLRWGVCSACSGRSYAFRLTPTRGYSGIPLTTQRHRSGELIVVNFRGRGNF